MFAIIVALIGTKFGLVSMTLPTHNNWTPVNSEAAQHLTALTNSPGVVYGMGTNALPQSLHRIPGVCSYYISGYLTPQAVRHGFTAVGEMLVARTDGATTKNYNYLVAVNSGGLVHFAGPYTGYGHHVVLGQQMAVNSLFGQTPLNSRSGL
jgi:hypothetical protein